jgi:prepilin-type N-terminal cleavage/methylation domain-containing protein
LLSARDKTIILLMIYNKPKRQEGFTLIELLVVIAIIGILASVVLSSLSTARSSARDTKRIAEARNMMAALELYRNANNGLYPCAGNVSPGAGNCNLVAGNSTGGIGWGVSRISGSGTLDTALRNALGFTPTDTSAATGIQYRVTTNPRTNYALLVYLENRRVPGTPWCRITYQMPNTLWQTSGSPAVATPSC